MTIERPMFPPRAASLDSFSRHPAIGQPGRQPISSDSPSPFDAIDLAQLRFVHCLVRYGATVEEAGAVVAAELKRLQTVARKQRRTLIGNRLVPVEVRQ